MFPPPECKLSGMETAYFIYSYIPNAIEQSQSRGSKILVEKEERKDREWKKGRKEGEREVRSSS